MATILLGDNGAAPPGTQQHLAPAWPPSMWSPCALPNYGQPRLCVYSLSACCMTVFSDLRACLDNKKESCCFSVVHRVVIYRLKNNKPKIVIYCTKTQWKILLLGWYHKRFLKLASSCLINQMLNFNLRWCGESNFSPLPLFAACNSTGVGSSS